MGAARLGSAWIGSSAVKPRGGILEVHCKEP